MRFLIILCFVFCSKIYSQENFIKLDTLNAQKFKLSLLNFYETKFTDFNSKLTTLYPSQFKQYKNLYTEFQSEFLEKINSDNFIADSKINNYLQNLLLEIINANNLNNFYKILVSNDSEVNAYNTGDGTIVVNYGLFTKLENEDELIFVLCHEIGHQELLHVSREVENIIKQINSEQIILATKEVKKQKYNRASMANSILTKLNYKNYFLRRKKETEADSLGLAYYKSTKRELKNTISLLEKLNSSNFEKDSVTEKDYKEIFEKEKFKIKNKYFENEETLFSKYNYTPFYEVDSLKTHPDCKTRIIKLQKYITINEGIKKGNDFFYEIKSNSLKQNLINLYISKEYGISLYETLKLLKNNKEDFFLKELIYLNLQKIYFSKLNFTSSKYIPPIDNIYNSKSLNRFINFINNIKNSDLELLINQFK